MGGYTDAETGLVLLGHRYYDPVQGRFLTRDPAGYGGGINLYGYTGNNPVNFSDPMGLWKIGGDADHPWLDFDDQGVSDGLATGMAAVGSAFTFGFWNGGCARFGLGFEPAAGLAGIGRDALITAATLGMGEALAGGGRAAELGEEAEEGAGNLCFRCFVAGTMVWMADNTTKPVEQVKQGDWVKSRDPNTGQIVAARVSQTFQRQSDALVTVQVSGADDKAKDGKDSKGETLTCSPDHPFFVDGQGWVAAGELSAGSRLTSRSGSGLSVSSVTWQRQSPAAKAAALSAGKQAGYAVYNFEVEKTHSYFVGTQGGGTWVHNAKCFPNTPEEMDDMMGFKGERLPDINRGTGQPLPGRGRIDWDMNTPNGRVRVTHEQHPYDTNAPEWHKGPHWHVDWPGRVGPHPRFAPDDPFPGS